MEAYTSTLGLLTDSYVCIILLYPIEAFPRVPGLFKFILLCFVCLGVTYLTVPREKLICLKYHDTYKKNCTKSTDKISVISVSLIFHGVGQMSKFDSQFTPPPRQGSV